MTTAKANPDDLVHEKGPLYVLSEETIRVLLHDVDEDVQIVLAELNQDNFVEVELITTDERVKIDLLQPPF